MHKVFFYKSEGYQAYIDKAFDELSISPNLTNGSIDFQSKRFDDSNIKNKNLSMILVEEEKPVFGYFGLSFEKAGLEALGMYDYGNYTYINNQWEKTSRGKKFIKDFIDFHLTNFHFIYQTTDSINRCINFYDQHLLNNEKKEIDIYSSKIINLENNSIDSIWSNIRSRYKSLINNSLKNDKFYLFDQLNVNEEIINNFQKLHNKVSGRVTRSTQTWEIIYQMIKNDEGFLSCKFKNKELISAGFFNHNSQHALYGISASSSNYNSAEFHPVMWKAIEYAHRRGLKKFELGFTDIIHSKNLKWDNKDKGIAEFKKGFGGESYYSLEIKLNIKTKN